MGYFRIIRIALTLSLMLATATQPMVGLRAAEGCAADAGRSHHCASCGCCEVDRPQLPCGCCTSADDGTAEDPHCHSTAAAADRSKRVNLLEPHGAMRNTVCMCRISPAPISEGTKHNRVTETNPRHDVVLGFTHPVEPRDSFSSNRPPKTRHARGNQNHFSQRVLGVWRI